MCVIHQHLIADGVRFLCTVMRVALGTTFLPACIFFFFVEKIVMGMRKMCLREKERGKERESWL